MPIYDYLCKKCGHRFEKIQQYSDPEIKKCPDCGGRVEKQMSAPAVQFKGEGWYVTDYGRNKGQSASKDGDSGEAGKGEGKAEPKGESKSEEKKPAKAEGKGKKK